MGVTFPNGFNFSSIFPWLCWYSVHFINSGTDDVLLFQSYLLFGTFQMVLNSLWHKMLFTWASHISPIILMSRVSPKPKYSRFIAKYTKINDTWPLFTKIFMKMSICQLKSNHHKVRDLSQLSSFWNIYKTLLKYGNVINYDESHASISFDIYKNTHIYIQFLWNIYPSGLVVKWFPCKIWVTIKYLAE